VSLAVSVLLSAYVDSFELSKLQLLLLFLRNDVVLA
jgi:hypothetical protein